MALNQALSGLNGAQSDLNVIANNIANANTTGFKGSRAEFADIIELQLEAMMKSITEAETAAGIGPDGVDLVLTTGGTSLIPAIRAMLEQRFGPERLKQRDTFTSVATGLAIVAQSV